MMLVSEEWVRNSIFDKKQQQQTNKKQKKKRQKKKKKKKKTQTKQKKHAFWEINGKHKIMVTLSIYVFQHFVLF